MTDLDRKHLAAAYMAAWYGVNKTPCRVEPAPKGWFMRDERRVRASELIKGLAVLAGSLERQVISGG